MAWFSKVLHNGGTQRLDPTARSHSKESSAGDKARKEVLTPAVQALSEQREWRASDLARLVPLGDKMSAIVAPLLAGSDGPLFCADAKVVQQNCVALCDGEPAAKLAQWLRAGDGEGRLAPLLTALVDFAASVYEHLLDVMDDAARDVVTKALKNDALQAGAVGAVVSVAGALDHAERVAWFSQHLPRLFLQVEHCLSAYVLGRTFEIPAAGETPARVVPWYLLDGMPLVESLHGGQLPAMDPFLSLLLHCSSARPLADLPAAIAASAPPVEPWRLLYTSSVHGFSLNTLVQRAADYPGSTLLVVHESSGAIYGVFLTEPWRDQQTFWGSKTCCIIDFAPRFSVYRATRQHTFFAFFSSASARNVKQGFGAGGTAKEPFLFIDGSLQRGARGGACTTYAVPFEPRRNISIGRLEVWGFGGAKAAQWQQAQRQWERRQVEKERARVDRRSEWAIDRTLLEWGGVMGGSSGGAM